MKGDPPIKMCWHCHCYMFLAKHVCPLCHTSQHAHSNAVNRHNKKVEENERRDAVQAGSRENPS